MRGPRNSAQSPDRQRASAPLILATLVALGALLARDSYGRSVLPDGVEILLQVPALALWLTVRCGLFRREVSERSRAGGDNGEIALTALMAIVAGLAAAALRRLDVSLGFLTLFIAGMLVLDRVAAWVRCVQERAGTTRAVVKLAVAGWLAAIFVGTILLSIPLATDPAVPDYRHNFWRHVVNCAYTAASAACLVGVSGYDVGGDYSAFGRLVIYVLMHGGALGTVLLGLTAIRPFLPRAPRLRTVVVTSLLVEILAAIVLIASSAAPATGDVLARVGQCLFLAGAALLNCGMSPWADGSTLEWRDPPVFAVLTALMIVGSIGVPLLIVAAGEFRRSAVSSDLDSVSILPARLSGREFAAAFWLLIVAAGALFVCESPGAVPELFVPMRPMDLGEHQSPLFESPPAVRWRGAVFLAAAARSCGLEGVPLAEGAINWVSFSLLCLWMWVGGGVASFAGGARTTTFLMLGALLTAPPSSPRSGEAVIIRRRVVRGLLVLLGLMIALPALSVGLLVLFQDASIWEIVFDGVATASGTGWTTGLAAHLTWPARCSMIVIMIVGRLVPLLCWCHLAASLPAPQAVPHANL